MDPISKADSTLAAPASCVNALFHEAHGCHRWHGATTSVGTTGATASAVCDDQAREARSHSHRPQRSVIDQHVTGSTLAVIPVGRPAHVPCMLSWESLGWQYMAPKISGHVYASVMLRSWEDRFGARLLVLGQDTMVLAVERRPRSGSALSVPALGAKLASRASLK